MMNLLKVLATVVFTFIALTLYLLIYVGVPTLIVVFILRSFGVI